MNKELIIDIAKMSHEKAYDGIKEDIKEIDMFEIIGLTVDVITKKRNAIDVAKELAIKYKKPIETYLKAFGSTAVEESLKNSNLEFTDDLTNEEFSNKVVAAVGDVALLINRFHKNDIDEAQFIQELCNSNVKDVGLDILNSLDIDINQIIEQAQNVDMFTPMLISYIAFSEAYKILEKAQEDARIQREKRLLIEEQCQKSIEMIKHYREEMKVLVSSYLEERITIFNEGFKIIDRAIVDNDINGYIKGNVIIQEMLGYDIQFRNEDEFEDLMNSDCAFKL